MAKEELHIKPEEFEVGDSVFPFGVVERIFPVRDARVPVLFESGRLELFGAEGLSWFIQREKKIPEFAEVASPLPGRADKAVLRVYRPDGDGDIEIELLGSDGVGRGGCYAKPEALRAALDELGV